MTKVLLVEDFPVMQKFYKDALERASYDLDVVSDGSLALEKVAEVTYDVILLDMLLPNLNGIEFLEQYTDRPAQTKILVLSDFTEPSRIKRAYELGAAGYLVKSDNPPSELVAKLDEVTGRVPGTGPSEPQQPTETPTEE